MDLKKVLDQTVRELKREVNKKVLKVPEIEQKVMEATSNEPWGPHGALMADIAQATRNYNEYQMIMSILWKRINDTGRNWRHVYKSLTVLEFLVAHGSERVIDEIREHSYQISTLNDFHYVESSGKDQGINVRKKSQALVSLVNDKEKIREVRQKAVSNRDKYRGVSSTGGMYKPSSYSSTGGSYGGERYDDDRYGSTSRYGSRDDDRYGRDRDGDRYRDEDRYSRDGDRYGRDGDRYGRDGDRYRDDYNGDYDHEEDRYSSRRGDDRSERYSGFERDRDRAYDDDDRHSSRSGGGRGDDYGHDDRRVDRKPSDARMPAPPSYEEALGSSESGYRSVETQRDGGGLAAAVARASKPNAAPTVTDETANVVNKAAIATKQSDDFDDFDPRASKVPIPAATPAEDDLFGQVETVVATKSLPPQQSISSAMSNASDLFGDSSFTSGFTQALPNANSTAFQQLNGDIFGDSEFKVDTPASSHVSMGNPPPSFGAISTVTNFTSAPVMNSSDGKGFSAFEAAPSNQTVPASFTGSDEFFGGTPFSAFGAAPSAMGATSSVLNQAPTATVSIPTVTASIPSQQSFLGAPQGQQPSLNFNVKPQQKDKFETKSTVWADTLSKGLIDLNIGGPKANPLADIGIDFDLLRTERIKEERATAKASTISMGKAMGSGSGLGIAGAGAIVPPAPPVMMNSVGMGPNMGMAPMGVGMGMGMGPGMGMMGPGIGMTPVMPMGVNPGMGMRPMGMGSVPGMGGYPSQQQQYGGFR